MTDKNLGRGLSAFLDSSELKEGVSRSSGEVIKISVDAVKRNPFQPRQTFDKESVNALAESVKRRGILQPIIVIKLGDGDYQLVAGERRLRAARIAGMTKIPAIITEMSRKDQLEVAILENIQREDLNPLDEAAAYNRLMSEFDHTQESLSEILGKSRSHVANTLRLLTLPDGVQSMIREGKLSFGHARALVGTDDAVAMANRVVEQSMNVRQVEELVKQRKKNHQPNCRRVVDIDGSKWSDDSGVANYIDPDISNLATQISALTGLRSNIKLKGNGGVLEISFCNFEELDCLVRKLNS
ncbi:MAG: ParB/RepB/Spo0J family partition protein [Holosporaceae bacterium]|jgi:ParB family chromosome partitioning protein|nr:ParB/RepB/Spo0J family partition protein [Holosporaceae bacterium]